MRHFLCSLLSIAGLSLFLGLSTPASQAQAADKLVMFDSRNCPSCIKFKREMAKPYWGSDLGRQLPLSIVRTSNRRAMARYRDQINPIVYTPTFVLISDGAEVGRFAGYNNKESFLEDVKELRGHWNK